MAQKKTQAQPKGQQQGGDEKQQLLASAPQIQGIDWSALLQQFSPVVLSIVIRILQQLQSEQGVRGTAKAACPADCLALLDEGIEQAVQGLCKIVCHRDCCHEEEVAPE